MGTKRKAAPSGNGNPMCLSQDKDKQILGQYQTTYLAFHGTPKTMLQVSNETGIRRANICRYVAKMRDNDQIQVIRYGLCTVSKFRAGFLSTDPTLFSSITNQPTLFDRNGI